MGPFPPQSQLAASCTQCCRDPTAVAGGTSRIPTHSSLCQPQSRRVSWQVSLPLARAGGCNLPSSSCSPEAAEQPVRRAPALRHPELCGARELGWGAASYLIFSSTLILLVILPVTERVKQSNPLKKQPDRLIVKGFSDPHLHWLEKNFASSSSNYRIIGPHSSPFVVPLCTSHLCHRSRPLSIELLGNGEQDGRRLVTSSEKLEGKKREKKGTPSILMS